MKKINPFVPTVSLIEMASKILEKKETIKLQKDSEIKIRRIKSRKPKNVVKVIKEKNGEMFYFIPGNMKIAGFENKINKNIDAIEEFKTSNNLTINI